MTEMIITVVDALPTGCCFWGFHEKFEIWEKDGEFFIKAEEFEKRLDN